MTRLVPLDPRPLGQRLSFKHTLRRKASRIHTFKQTTVCLILSIIQLTATSTTVKVLFMNDTE